MKISANTSYTQLKALVPDASDQKMQGRTLVKSTVPVLISVEDSGLTISVYANGFFTAQDDRGHVTARAVWNCEAMVFDAAVGAPESVSEEVYGSLPFPMVLSYFGQRNLDDQEYQKAKRHHGISLSESNVKETDELSVPDFADEVCDRLDGDPIADRAVRGKAALESLNPKQQKAFILYHRDGMTYEQGSKVIGGDKSSVRKLILRAEKNLKNFLQKR